MFKIIRTYKEISKKIDEVEIDKKTKAKYLGLSILYSAIIVCGPIFAVSFVIGFWKYSIPLIYAIVVLMSVWFLFSEKFYMEFLNKEKTIERIWIVYLIDFLIVFAVLSILYFSTISIWY